MAQSPTRETTTTDIKESILDTIGETPLVRLRASRRTCSRRSSPRSSCFNPGGSIKDRVAIRLIEAAERDGRLKPGGTIIEPTSGNTGHGPGDRRAPEGLPRDRRDAGQDVQGEDRPAARLRRRGRGRADRRGARVAAVLLPRGGPPDRGDPRRVPAEPVRQPGQPGDALPAPGPSCGARAAGRSRTSSPASAPAGRSPASARYLKERNPEIQVIGADPVGSIYSGDEVHPYLVEGVGEDFWPRRSIRRSSTATCASRDRDSFLTARRLGRGRGPAGRRLLRHRAVRRARRSRASSTTRARWSRSCCPTAGAPT